MEAIRPTEPSEIQSFYADTNVLITGGTGFLGKVLLEKLLRTCPDIRTVYLLVRPKKGKHVHARCEELFENPVFERLHREQPKFQHRVQAVAGDCSLPDLGLSAADKTLLQQQVNVVFHAAATVRFDEKLRLATAINVKGCREMLALCRGMSGLKALVHVSTAYANCPWSHVEERFHTPPQLDYEKLIALTDSTDDKQLEQLMTSGGILERWPNTYSFTKAVAEDLVRRESESLPTVVFRPSIVVSTYKEPVRGWVDNLYGATGVCAGAGVGILRTLHCDPECISNITPVDTTVNALICSAWDVARRHAAESGFDETPSRERIPVYNYVSTRENSLSWGKFMSLCDKSGVQYPSVRAVWYYSLTLNKHWLVHWLYVVLLHLLPGLLVDGALLCTGRRPRMLRIYRNIVRYNTVISYFCLNTWSFDYENVLALWERLSRRDKKLFFFDMRQVEWEEYFREYMFGMRLYLLKDAEHTLPQARVKWRLFYWMHQAGKLAVAFGLLRLTWWLLQLLL